MFAWFKRLLWDETAFVGYLRGTLMGVGAAVSTDLLQVQELGVPKWAGIAMLAAGGFVRSSGAAGDAMRREAPKP